MNYYGIMTSQRIIYMFNKVCLKNGNDKKYFMDRLICTAFDCDLFRKYFIFEDDSLDFLSSY